MGVKREKGKKRVELSYQITRVSIAFSGGDHHHFRFAENTEDAYECNMLMTFYTSGNIMNFMCEIILRIFSFRNNFY